jgi:hypothetical protein
MSGLATMAIAAAGLVGAAAPAQAAVNHDIVWDCTSNDVFVDAQVGDTITFQSADCASQQASGYDPTNPASIGFTTESPAGVDYGWNFRLPVTGGTPLTDQVQIMEGYGNTPLARGDTIAWLSPIGDIVSTPARVIFGSASTPIAGPAPVHQGLPLPVSGSCADIQDVNYAWGTGLTGGWTKAWEPWVNLAAGKGGWACTRALVASGSIWVLQA